MMQHIAIMKKEWGLLSRILSGEKKIESRWYYSRCAPWDRIKKDEIIYFKDSGCPVTLKAKVRKIIQFKNLTPKKVRKIINQHGDADGIDIRDKKKFFELFKNKKYCLLVFIKDVKKIKPFNVNKAGFGMMSAWLTFKNINQIKK